MGTDYLPTKDSELALFGGNFATRVTAAPAIYGLVANDAVQITEAKDDFAAKLAIATAPTTRTDPAIVAKDAAKATLTAILRGYAMLIKRNRAVSDDDKVGLGIGVYDYSPSPVPPPTTFPVISVLKATPRQHELHFNDSATPDKKSKPAGAAGLILFCHVLEASAPPPANGSAAQFKALVTKAKFIMDFGDEEVGKKAYYFARWHTSKGLLGPWSLVASMMVA